MRKQLFATLLVLAAASACKKSNDELPRTAPDNTAQNARDRTATPTADNAVTTPADRDMTQKIRQAVVDDGSLSTNAHNCKIVVKDGTVTLVGPVANAAERTRVEQLALAVVGDRKVVNQLEVTN